LNRPGPGRKDLSGRRTAPRSALVAGPLAASWLALRGCGALRPGAGMAEGAVRRGPQVAPLGVPEPRGDAVDPLGLGDRQRRTTPSGGVQAVPGVAGQL